MRKLLILFFILFTANTIFSQDLVITSKGDSINCKITKVNSDNIYFTFKYEDEIRSRLMPLLKVEKHIFNYYAISEVPENKHIGHDNYNHFRLAINGGFGYRIGVIPDDISPEFKDYIKELKTGYVYSGDLSYFITKYIGFGLKYNFFNASNSMDDIYIEDMFGNRRYGKMSDDISITFIGPTFTTRFIKANKNDAIILNVGVGYLGYNNDLVIIDKYNISGSSMGLTFDFGYDIALSSDLALGIQLSIISGSLFQYTLDDGNTKEIIILEEGEFESLNRIDLSVGLRFGK